jgi:CHAT domain-containing protein
VLSIERRITQLWRQLLVRSADYLGQAALWQAAAQPTSLNLPPGTVLVEYTVARGVLLAFVASDEDVFCVRLEMQPAEAERLLNLLQVNVRTVATQGQLFASRLVTNANALLGALYDGLLAPVLALPDSPLPRAERLLSVPHGPLHYLPFHALYDGERHLATRYEVSYLPSVDRLPRLARRTRVANGAALVLGISGTGSLGQGDPRQQARLQHAVEEAKHVAQLMNGAPFLDEAACVQVLRDYGRHAPVVHLATHAEFRADNPLFSGLQLADTWLTTLDIFGLELEASLVTLSGCHTGRSVLGGGEELLGLARAFFAAGAASLLLSLWAVEDISTAEFMRLFYRDLAAGATKAAALHHAQVAFISDERYHHPYYWAPFALIGDTGSLRPH